MPTQKKSTSRRSIVLFIAAHNEEDTILCALKSVERQTRRPDHVVVVADRCTDATVARATAQGAEVFETVDNVHRKAGALNQALRMWLPLLDHEDIVVMMDADTELSPQFIESGERRFDQRSDKRHAPIGAVGGVFTAGRPLTGLIWALQRNEYLRYGHDLNRRHGRADVITGTSGMFRVSVLHHIAAERGDALPSSDYVYSDSAVTEDDELTLALKTLVRRGKSN